jgi:hypothetical protein
MESKRDGNSKVVRMALRTPAEQAEVINTQMEKGRRQQPFSQVP